VVWLVVVLMVILAVEAVTEWPGDGCGGRGHDLRKEGRKEAAQGGEASLRRCRLAPVLVPQIWRDLWKACVWMVGCKCVHVRV
jgi:hypothetical protein